MSASPSPSSDALQGLLAVEHLAVYGYGLVGARLTGPALLLARECEQTHRARRDVLALRLTDRSASPVPAAAAYDLPGGGDVPDAAAALGLAAQIEDQVAGAQAAAAAGSSDAEVRTAAVTTVADAAVRAARWRLAAGISPATVAFPGRA